MFTLRLANGKESSFESASDLANWYQKEKRASLSSAKATKSSQLDGNAKREQKGNDVENV